MQCKNIKCPYYRKPEKRDYVEKMLGVTNKNGGCKHSYCKARK